MTAATDPPTEDRPSAFLSYARQDKAFARKLVKALGEAGLRVWWDDMLPTGATFIATTETALRNADAVVVLWSPVSVASHWVRDEATVGRDKGNLVPMAIGGALPPLGFGQFHAADLSRWNGRAQASELVGVVDAVRRCATVVPAKVAAPPAQSGLARRTMLAAGGGAAALAGLGALGWHALPRTPAPAGAVKSLAVLPFANQSGDPKQSYFSDGLTDDLRTMLSQNPQLNVAALSSSNIFRDLRADPAAIAARLHVDHLVTGSVQRTAQTIRIEVQLVDVATGFLAWSQHYDRPLSEIFALQDEIATKVSRSLSVHLLGQGKTNARRGGTDDLQAYDAYLQGVALYNLVAGDDSDRAALAAFDRALALDPNYAAAFAAKARALTALANGATDLTRGRLLYEQAIAVAQRAVAIAPNDADGHAALGYALLDGRLDVAAAHAPYQRSVELAGNDADILAGFATYATRTGDFAAADQAITKAITLDPINPYARRTAGNLLFAERNYPGAIDRYRAALTLDPNMHGTHGAIGDAFTLTAQFDAARGEYQAEKSQLYAQKGLAIVAARRGDIATSDAALKRLVDAFGSNGLYQQAEVLAQRGAAAAALERLAAARRVGDAGLILARNDPFLDPLRGSATFRALLLGMGFAPAA